MAFVGIQIGITVALSVAAMKLQQKKQNASLRNLKPTPSVERGSPIPLLIGRQRLAPVMLWTGDRSTEHESSGGKGGLVDYYAPQQKIFYEKGMLGLCIGPARRLWSIHENGKRIFKGPIDPVSHPSGTSIDLGKPGKVSIYWGEAFQPVNVGAGASGRVGVESKWPFLCYLYWTKKRLGTTPTWGRLSADVEVWPYNSKLCATPAVFNPTRTLVGEQQSIQDVVSGSPGTNYYVIDGGKRYKPSNFARIEGQGPAVPDGDYPILRKESFTSMGMKKRRIYINQTLTGLTADTGTSQPYKDDDNDGINPAHIIHQLLFEGYPHGMGRDPNLYDFASLENVGVISQAEELRSTLLVDDFNTVASALGGVLQDLGCLFAMNPTTGLLQFRPVRPGETAAVLPEDVLVGDAPEIETIHIDLSESTRKLFEFEDRARDYSIANVTVDNDGEATRDKVYGQKKIRIFTARDFPTAAIIAKRRDQETYLARQEIRLTANREARLLMPGQTFTVPGIDSTLLLLESRRMDVLSGKVELRAAPDYYGITASNAVYTSGGGQTPDDGETDSDPAVIPWEMPQVLINSGASPRVLVARLREDSTVSGAQIHLSPDDVTYTLLGQEEGLHTGGTMNDALGSDGPSLLDLGPIITALGPDITQTLDLSASADKLAWQLGRHVAIVGTGTATEIWFVRYIDALGGDQYQLREVLRHRYDSLKLAHPVDTPVVMLDEARIESFFDLTLKPGSTFYVKSQPFGNSSEPLDEVVAQQLDLYGKGVRPLPVTGLHAGGPDSRTGGGYKLGEDVEIRWGYRGPPGTDPAGAGYFDAGDAVFQRSPVDGLFRMQIFTGITLKRTVVGDLAAFTLPDGSVGYDYTWAEIASDFAVSMGFSGSVNFQIEMSVVKGSQQSTLATFSVFSEGGTAP